jgi:hypothetical protein
MSIQVNHVDAVLERIREDELVELALHLANVESPPGEEGPAGEAIHAWLVS